VALGALVGLALGIGYAVVRYALDRRIRSAQDVETEVGVPVIGRIPLNRALDGMDKDGQDAAAFGEAIRALRTNLQFMDVDSPPRVVVLTSPAPGDGKSTIAARLAASLAVSGRAVTLIDADLRRPTLAARLGLPEGAGLSDVLSGRAALEDVLHHAVGTPRLDVLTAGFIPPNPSEILGSDRMRELIDALASHSLVIIDAPPILAVTDAAILSNRADGAFVIASAGRTTYDLLERSVAVLTQANGRVLGVVVNRLSRRDRGTADYGYHYAYRAASTAPRQPVDEPVMGAKA
jgi:capsular exopolysaccharide synthesis family protein